jgi:two-component system, sensor histidine kinase and response regulator
MSGDRDLCLAAGMDSYISKPINLQSLVDTLERVRTQRETAPLPQ